MTSSTCGRLLLVLLLLRPASARADEPAPEAITVEDAVRIALENHPALGAARAQRSAAGFRTRQAWAPMLPGLTGSLVYQPQTANFVATPGFARAVLNTATGISVGIDRQCGPDDGACAAQAQPCVFVPGQPGCFPVPRGQTPHSASLFNFYQAQVGINWLLFDFGRTYYGARSAGEAETTFDRAAEAAELQTRLDARVAFYNALASEELVAVAAESVATQRKHLEQMRAFVEVGTRTRVDLAQARADEASAELQLAQARGQRDTSIASLHDALGLESWREFRLVPPPPEGGPPAPLPPTALEALVEEAVAARPEVKQLEAQARAAEQQRKSVRGAWFPQLNLSLGPSFAGNAFESLTPNFTLTLQLAYPLLGMNPYLVLNQGREAEANLHIALEQGRLTRNRVRLETAQALATLRSAREAVAAAQLLVEAATERRELQSGRFEAGLGTVLELQDAEFAYVNARGQQVQASYTLRIAGARIERALGR